MLCLPLNVQAVYDPPFSQCRPQPQPQPHPLPTLSQPLNAKLTVSLNSIASPTPCQPQVRPPSASASSSTCLHVSLKFNLPPRQPQVQPPSKSGSSSTPIHVSLLPRQPQVQLPSTSASNSTSLHVSLKLNLPPL
jgi:hypothetical protein